MYRRVISCFMAFALITSLAFSCLLFSAFADGDDEQIVLIDYRLRQYSNDPTTYITARVPLQEMQVFGQGQAFGIDELRFDVGYMTKGHIYYVVNFSCVDFNTNTITLGSTRVTIDSGFTFGSFTDFTNTDGFTVSIWLYNSPNKLFDIPADLKYISGTQTYVDDYPASANSLCMLISIEVPADHGQVLSIDFNNPLIIKSNSYYPDDVYWYCSNFQFEYNYAAALYNLISLFADDLDDIDDVINDIYDWLNDHSDEIEDIPSILSALTNSTSSYPYYIYNNTNTLVSYLARILYNKNYRYYYLSNNNTISFSAATEWYNAILNGLNGIFYHDCQLFKQQWLLNNYTYNSDGSITKTSEDGTWFKAILATVRHLDLIVDYFMEDRILQNDAEDAGLIEFGADAYDKAGDSIDDLRDFLDIPDMGTFNSSAMGTAGNQSFLDWFSQHNKDMIDNVPLSRAPVDIVDFMTPHLQEIEDILGGDDDG